MAILSLLALFSLFLLLRGFVGLRRGGGDRVPRRRPKSGRSCLSLLELISSLTQKRLKQVAKMLSLWAEQNVNPALFPRELMANASDLVMDEEVSYNPQILLKKAMLQPLL
uniref:Uncharacterized protein n=1 Tax=Ananas comosus var. bracteatus TaxID=296719 RepID=A0A6V7Q9Q3_ANACO|nr:unnamed protein product [Ananas comosus var. bracteatus]